MSAIRLRLTAKGLEVLLDDEIPQSEDPIRLIVRTGGDRFHPVDLTIEEAGELAMALSLAAADAEYLLAHHDTIRRGGKP